MLSLLSDSRYRNHDLHAPILLLLLLPLLLLCPPPHPLLRLKALCSMRCF